MAGPVVAGRQGLRRDALRAHLAGDPLLTDAALARVLGVSVQTVRLDRLVMGIPEVRDRARAFAERTLQGRPWRAVHGEVLDLDPGVSAVALLPPDHVGVPTAPWARDPELFADAEALALVASGWTPADVHVANVKFRRPARAGGRLVAKAEVLRRRAAGGRLRAVVLVQIRSGDQAVFRAKFVVGAAERP